MSGHGHVTPNADGSKARCGGPGMCPECSIEFAQLHAHKKTVDITCSDLLDALEAACRREAVKLARAARAGDEEEKEGCLQRYIAFENAMDAERSRASNGGSEPRREKEQ